MYKDQIEDMNGYWVENNCQEVWDALLALGFKPLHDKTCKYPQVYVERNTIYGADMARDYPEIYKRKEAKLENGRFTEAPFRVTLAHQLIGQ